MKKKRRKLTTVIDRFEKGETQFCPHCKREGRKQRYCCWIHRWVYRKWWENYKHAFSQS